VVAVVVLLELQQLVVLVAVVETIPMQVRLAHLDKDLLVQMDRLIVVVAVQAVVVVLVRLAIPIVLVKVEMVFLHLVLGVLPQVQVKILVVLIGMLAVALAAAEAVLRAEMAEAVLHQAELLLETLEQPILAVVEVVQVIQVVDSEMVAQAVAVLLLLNTP
jgi:hypothetical protein